MAIWCFPRWNRFWTMYMTLILVLNYRDPVNLVEILFPLRFHTTSDIHHNTIRSDLASESSCVWYCERTSDKHRFSTACRSGNHTDKRMYPWHEMIGIVSVWNPKQKRIIGFQNIIGFFFINLLVLLLLRRRRHISLCQRRRWRCISLCQRFLGYLVEIPQIKRGRDRKRHWSTTQHLEQLRSHPKGNHPLSVLWLHSPWRQLRSHHLR